MPDAVQLDAYVSGEVQGVGFRAWTRKQARRLELVGLAENLPDGRVHVVAEGPREACERLLSLVRDGWTPGSVSEVEVAWADPTGRHETFGTG